MYSILTDKVVDNLVSSAIQIIKKSREIYNPFFLIVEDFILENKLIIGGKYANLLILNNTDKEINKIYDIYTEEPKNDAIELANRLFNYDPNGIARYTTVFPKLPNNIYQISLNGYIICNIYNIPIYKGIQIEKLITCQFINSIKNKKLLCMGNYIQLINLYKNINNPSNVANWEQNLNEEINIRKKYLEDINEHMIKKNNIVSNKYNKYNMAPNSKYIDLKFIYDKFICNSNRVLIGDAATYILKHKQSKYEYLKKFRLQLITINNLEEDGKELVKLGKDHNIEIFWMISQPKYIEDLDLRRLTAKIKINGKQKTILDIFNYGEYNIIGHHIHHNIKYGSIFILMIFTLFEKWIFQLLHELKSITDNEIKIMLANNYNNYLLLSNKLEKLWNEEKLIDYINDIEYIGTYKDIHITMRRKSAKILTHFSRYYPLKPKLFKLSVMKEKNNDY
jgi:hypothetical protein